MQVVAVAEGVVAVVVAWESGVADLAAVAGAAGERNPYYSFLFKSVCHERRSTILKSISP